MCRQRRGFRAQTSCLPIEDLQGTQASHGHLNRLQAAAEMYEYTWSLYKDNTWQMGRRWCGEAQGYGA